MRASLVIVLTALTFSHQFETSTYAQTTGAVEPAAVELAATEPAATEPAIEQMPILSQRAVALKSRLDNLPATKLKARQKQLEDINAFYEKRNFEPVWWKGSEPTEQALALTKAISRARLNALDPADYPLLDMNAAAQDGLSAVVEADLAVTLAAVRYAIHLSAGRVRPRSLSRHVTPVPERPEVDVILNRLSSASDVAAALRYFEPVHEQYWLLKNKLANLLAETDSVDIPEIPAGEALRLGSRGQRVTLLKQRLGIAADSADGSQDFDTATQLAVKTFQRENGLVADGIAGRGTLSVLNRDSRQNLIALMITNIERWRWMPRELGTFHVAVNIPEYRVRIVDQGEETHTTRIIVGKRSNPTPVFSDEIEHIIVNPFWNIPSSILNNEMMSDILIDPEGFFARTGYQLLARVEGRRGMRKVHPEMVDWWTVDPKSVLVRQPPGRNNALGRIKFMFPNRHAVYLHDTPTKNLFERALRAFSHGCVRVNNPMHFADALLAHDPDWNAARLKRLFGDEERRVDLNENIPVHLTYFTAIIDDDGSVETFPDIYGYDSIIRRKTIL